MLRRSRPFLTPLLLLLGVLLAGCTGLPAVEDPTGVAFVDRVLAFLADPNVAYLLLVLGLLAVIAEATVPGTVAPGVIGAIMLVLSLYGLINLPTNWLGPVLIITGVVMLLVDIKVTGIALSVGGIFAFLLGSLLIFTPPWMGLPSAAVPVARLNPFLMIGTTLIVGLFFFLGLAAAFRAQLQPVAMGRETIIGKTGTVRQRLQPGGIVHVEGEEWMADNVTGEDVPAGATIRVTGIDGLRLRVERAADPFERR